MKKVIAFTFILCVACMIISGLMGYFTLAAYALASAVMLGFVGFYLLLRQSVRVTSKAARMFKNESLKAYSSINLFYKLEKLNLSRGAKQLFAGEKKSKILMRLVEKRFAGNSLTSIRFKQEIQQYAQRIVQNLEQIVCNKESLSSVNPRVWKDQIWQLQRTGTAQHKASIEELQQQLVSYESLGQQYKALLAENDELLADMDKAILALNRENNKIFVNNNQGLLTGEDAFMHKFLYQ